MGGSAFASEPHNLYTPRMPPAVFFHMREICQTRMCSFFTYVRSPLVAPEKQDHGDVDIIVAQPTGGAMMRCLTINTHDDKMEVIKALGISLGAKSAIRDGGGVLSAHFALPWPTHLDDSTAEDGREKFVQVDVRICETKREWDWIFFKHSHGDMWNIIGSIIRPFGLTADDKGLWLRVPEIERLDKKRARVFLTDQPHRVVEFLSFVDPNRWTIPFESVKDLFEWIAGCDMFDPAHKEEGSSDKAATSQSAAGGEQSEADADMATVMAADKRALKANDRRRMNMRPHFRMWVEDFVPAYRENGVYEECITTREDIREHAFIEFPQSKEYYESRLCEFVLERQRLDIKNKLLKELIPISPLTVADRADGGDDSTSKSIHPQQMVAIASRLRKVLLAIIFNEQGKDADACTKAIGGTPGESLRTDDGYIDMEKAREWVIKVKDKAWKVVEGKVRGEGAARSKKSVVAEKQQQGGNAIEGVDQASAAEKQQDSGGPNTTEAVGQESIPKQQQKGVEMAAVAVMDGDQEDVDMETNTTTCAGGQA